MKTISAPICNLKSLQLFQLFDEQIFLKGNTGRGMSVDFKKSLWYCLQLQSIYMVSQILSNVWMVGEGQFTFSVSQIPDLLFKKAENKNGIPIRLSSKHLFFFSVSLYKQLTASLMETTNI